jgi:two-component system, cell cycle sensor histidine kinase and response regulator CckA
MNLVGNASAALDGCEGTVRVRADVVDVKIGSRFYRLGAKSAHYVRVVVADTGSGMDEKTVARIFDPFFTTKAVGQGTGLGLSVVHAIVERSRGLIDVTSTVGQGTEFTILLPVLDQTDETELLKSA